MRKKANQADIEYINNHTDMSEEEISTTIGLSLGEVKKHKVEIKPKKPSLGRSKITLKNGQAVYQMTEDIDSRPSLTRKPSEERDVRAGIYRTR